jgi:hypothetical protein
VFSIITNKKNISDEPYYLVMTLSENIQNLRKVKIHFENQQDEESGFYELMMSGMPAVALDNGRYLNLKYWNRMVSTICQTNEISPS